MANNRLTRLNESSLSASPAKGLVARKISLIVYDFDGTLVDTLFDIADAVNLSLNELGLRTLSRATIRKYVGKGVERLMAQSIDGTGYTDLPRAVELFRRHYSENLMNHTRFYPSGREILDHFRDKKQAICSNKPEDFVRRILESLKSLDTSTQFLAVTAWSPKNPIRKDCSICWTVSNVLLKWRCW